MWAAFGIRRGAALIRVSRSAVTSAELKLGDGDTGRFADCVVDIEGPSVKLVPAREHRNGIAPAVGEFKDAGFVSVAPAECSGLSSETNIGIVAERACDSFPL